MDAGKLRHRVDIDERVTSQDVYGEEVVTWQPWLQAEPAHVADISGREYLAQLGAGLAAQITTRIKIRWRPGVVPTMRVRHFIAGGSPPDIDTYDIRAVLRDETGRDELTLLCQRGVNEG